MILRICRFSFTRCALALSVLVAAGILLCAPLVSASDDATPAFLQNFRRQIRALEYLWPQSGSAYCTWPHILCNTTTGMASLQLSGLNLKGRYPQVNDLDGSQIFIESIDMSFNPDFDATLRKDWRSLSHLRRLDLSSTHTDGDLPDDWGDLNKLEYLNLSNTKVDDDIPGDWRGMSSLVVLDLRNTEVDDMDVGKLGVGMQSLEVLQLGETEIRKILEDLTSPLYFPRLRILNVSNPVKTKTDYLPSRLATWASGLPNLKYVGFDGFGFTGCVPDSYRTVPVLMQAARRANAGLVLRKEMCSTYTCTSPTQLSDGTKAFLDILRSTYLMRSAAPRWRSDDYCSWPGVVCPVRCGAGITVNLSAVPLAGSIPDSFADLGESSVLIDSFVIRDNDGFFGSLPPSLATALSLVQRVELSGLAIMGTIPAAFSSSLHYVEHLAITHTRLCGPLPSWDTVFLPPLRYADLSNNRMGGALAASWASLPLDTVDLRGNDFCGCVPVSWRSVPLLMHALDSAVLSAGTAAACAFLNGCGNLNQQCDGVDDVLAATDTVDFLTTLGRSFPSQLGSWGGSADYCDGSWKGVWCRWTVSGARELFIELADARLNGTLPELPSTVVGSRVLVASINMSTNPALTGNLPVSWGRLSYLRTLDLNGGLLRGDLPTAWEGMTSLETLFIAGSRLCRGLPNWNAANMPNLKSFDVSGNIMYGGLTDSFGSFGPQMQYFNLRRNKFCGCVPSSWKPYHVLNAGVDNVVATAQCALAYNACGRYAMRCEDVEDTLLNFKDVNWNFLDVIRRHLSVDLNSEADSKAMTTLATWSSYEFCDYAGVTCSFHDGDNGFALDLKGVGLRGTLPSISSVFRSAVAARRIDLSNNPSITGTLPPSWGELTNLLYLDLSGTSVASAIPTAWQGMRNLLHLSVAQTMVCGVLPSWSANALVSVVSLDFSHSKLAGTLGEGWGSFGLSNLATLNLDGNTGLCSCAPREWLEGHVLPDALVKTFGTIPQISDTCESLCSSPPSCTVPEDGNSGDTAMTPHGVRISHATAVVILVLLIW